MAPLAPSEETVGRVIRLPLPAGTFTDADLAFHTSKAAGKLLAENAELMIENACLRSGWLSVMRRIESMQLTRWRYLIVGAALGAVVALVADGTVAQDLNRLLNALGWVAS